MRISLENPADYVLGEDDADLTQQDMFEQPVVTNHPPSPNRRFGPNDQVKSDESRDQRHKRKVEQGIAKKENQNKQRRRFGL